MDSYILSLIILGGVESKKQNKTHTHIWSWAWLKKNTLLQVDLARFWILEDYQTV